MKSTDTIPSTAPTTAMNTLQERQRRVMELQVSQMNETHASSSSHQQHSQSRMRPIVLSRKRNRGNGMDRQQLSSLLTEALNITKDFEKEHANDKFEAKYGDDMKK
jgi:hypothetical protein